MSRRRGDDNEDDDDMDGNEDSRGAGDAEKNRNVLIPLFHNVSGVPVFEDVQPGKFFTGGVGQAKRSYRPTLGEWQMLYQRGYNPRSGDFYDEPDYDYE